MKRPSYFFAVGWLAINHGLPKAEHEAAQALVCDLFEVSEFKLAQDIEKFDIPEHVRVVFLGKRARKRSEQRGMERAQS